MAATATSSTSSALTKSSNAAPVRAALPHTRVAIRDGKTIAINDHIYISPPWAPGSGEPYIVARVMEFVTASTSRKGGQVLANSSGILQVRANVFLRQRDIHNKALTDPRLLVATMHSDVFALENVRGLCVVRHRDLIGEAPEIAAWKKREDHFYYHQLYDRYLHRYFDVILTDKIRNVPDEVLAVLRQRYSFVVVEPSMTPDLCGALRKCFVCEKWASSAESVRCDTCKHYFHMCCLTPPLASKPAKGYSWTCAPCSRRNNESTAAAAAGLPQSRAAALDASAAIASSSYSSSDQTENASYTFNRISDSSYRGASVPFRGSRGRGRGRGRGGTQALGRPHLLLSDEVGSDQSRESSPSPANSLLRRTIDDERGTRCYERWPFRYFGECTVATDILDPHDSIYPRAPPRLGVKYQASPITWEEQKMLGIGVKISKEVESSDGTSTPVSEEAFKVKRPPGRPRKKKEEVLPTAFELSNVASPLAADTSNLLKMATDRDIERGTDDSVDVLYQPGKVPEKKVDKYLKVCKAQMSDIANHIGMLNRALRLLMQYDGDAGRGLHELTHSTNEQLDIDVWTPRELKQFDKTVSDYNADLRFLKREIPTKTAAQLVRQFAMWKCKKIGEQLEQEKKQSTAGAEQLQVNGVDKSAISQQAQNDQATRAISPSLSIMESDDSKASGQTQLPSKVCRMCTTGTSSIWYKGPVAWLNRRLCINCGLYWRKYGAEMPSSHPEMVSMRKRDAAAMEEAALGVAPPIKVAKMARQESAKGSSSSPAQSIITIAIEPIKCVLCRKMEPKRKLQQCRQCSLSVHQGCYGLSDSEVQDESWLCEACANERTLDAALTPQCILCPRSKSIAPNPSTSGTSAATALGTADSTKSSVLAATIERGVGRPRKSGTTPTSAIMQVVQPLGPLDAVKPTECNNWTHLSCALFMPDVVFTEPERMRIVEGAGNLPLWRYEATCDICQQRQGACVGCAESSCRRTFHISCASQQPTFSLGLDLSPVKSTRRDTVVTTTFRGETGHIAAVVYCNAHREAAKARKLLDLSEIDASTGMTATQAYVNTHKGVKISAGGHYEQSSYPLLRRAKRFDAVLSGNLHNLASVIARRGSRQPLHHIIRLSSSLAAEDDRRSSSFDDRSGTPVDDKALVASQLLQSSQKRCLRCKTVSSPFWWDLPNDAQEADRANDGTWLRGAKLSSEGWVLCVRCRHSVLPRLAV